MGARLDRGDRDREVTPDWWLWEYFGTLALSDSNLDSQGNTLLYDYQNGIDPNLILFSLNFACEYVNGNTAYGTINLQEGVPFYQAVSSTTPTLPMPTGNLIPQTWW